MAQLDAIIAYWKKTGSAEWPGVKRMLELRDQMHGELGTKLGVKQM